MNPYLFESLNASGKKSLILAGGARKLYRGTQQELTECVYAGGGEHRLNRKPRLKTYGRKRLTVVSAEQPFLRREF